MDKLKMSHLATKKVSASDRRYRAFSGLYVTGSKYSVFKEEVQVDPELCRIFCKLAPAWLALP